MAKMLINGDLLDKPNTQDGAFIRMDSGFNDWISRGPNTPYPAAVGRYHLYISKACPWSHRALVMRTLKKLDQVISVTEMNSFMGENGWQIDQQDVQTTERVSADPFLYEVYLRADPKYTGAVTVPLLVDRQTARIVSNNSADIMRMLNSDFNDFTTVKTDYYPAPLRARIDAMNDYIYDNVGNAVYQAGFTTNQTVYETAVDTLFMALDRLDRILSSQRYLLGDTLTEADWRLFPTLIRFDTVYVQHFKTNRQRIDDYCSLGPYLRDLYQVPGIRETVDMDHITKHYHLSHRHINPSGIIPRGPWLNLDTPHGRDATDPPLFAVSL